MLSGGALLVGLAAGLAVGAPAWWALRAQLGAGVFARHNHRGVPVPTAAGLVLALTALVVAAGVALGESAGGWRAGAPVARGATLTIVVGFALLGLVDDVAGRGEDGRGFRGHLAALAQGRLTTGGLKLVGGGALALAVCAPVSGGGPGRLLADALLVALAANLGNLLDRAPGRTIKAGLVAFAVLALATGLEPELAGVSVVVGAGLALLRADLGERLMLGDTGANALGGVLGLGVVLTTAPGTRLVVLAAVVALNLASEVVSFSRVIESVPPLRAFDQAGRRPPSPGAG